MNLESTARWICYLFIGWMLTWRVAVLFDGVGLYARFSFALLFALFLSYFLSYIVPWLMSL